MVPVEGKSPNYAQSCCQWLQGLMRQRQLRIFHCPDHQSSIHNGLGPFLPLPRDSYQCGAALCLNSLFIVSLANWEGKPEDTSLPQFLKARMS